MSTQEIICPRCKAVALPGAEYCRHCGEVLSQQIRNELQRLAIVLRDLDTRIAANKGSQTVADLREELFLHYQTLRRAPWLRQAPAAEARPAPAPAAPVSQAPAATRSEFIPPPAAPEQPVIAQAQRSVRPPAPTPAAPAGPVFSWRAFAAEQAIAIMAYIGGFLGLVATLTLVVNKGDTDALRTLGIVALVYVGFGGGGFGLRRVERMRTVSRVYLAVFALMTPLMALALYRYELQSLNVPTAGMLCISAFYATLVYLGLAVQTRFVTYAYLGWVALIVAALAIIPWFHIDLSWWVFDLGVTTLALLGPHRLRLRLRSGILAEPATQTAALATVPVVIGVQALGIIGLSQTLVPGAFPTIYIDAGALALGACVQVPITAGWRLTVPSWRPRQQAAIIDTIDGFNAVFFAEAVGGVTIWLANLQGNVPLNVVARPVAISLAATGLCEYGLAWILYRRQPQRRGLRLFLEALGVTLGSIGAVIVLGDAPPNWPIIIALGAALVVSVGAALIDGAWWLLVGGFFLMSVYYRLALVVLPPEQVKPNAATLFFALALALWVAALAVGLAARGRRFVAPIYVVALASALDSLLFLGGHDALYQTELLLVFTAAAFSAGLRERQPILGSVVTGFFGALAALPLAISGVGIAYGAGPLTIIAPSGLPSSVLALGLALAALVIRRLWGRVWALAPYAIALWAVIVAAGMISTGGLRVPDWSASGLPFTAWFLLVFALVAYGVALWEKQPLATIVPAALAYWALLLVKNDIASVALVFALTAAGMAARQRRGRWWGAALQIAAAAGSVSVTLQLNNLGAAAPNWQAASLLALAVAAYLVAAQERQPILSAVAVVYALVGVALLPGPDHLLPTLVITFTLAGLGAIRRLPALRALYRREWAYAPYAAAIGASIFATQRVVPFNAGQVEGLLLVFAAVAYILAALEDAPQAAIVPLLYAVASVFEQPDAHALLPLALGFAVLGLLAGRVAGLRWSWAFYAAALVAAAGAIIGARGDTSFQAIALLILAALAYVIAAVESRPDVLLVALALGGLALGTGASALRLASWQSTLAFVALGWLYTLGAAGWAAIPWLRPTRGVWWAEARNPQAQNPWRDPRIAGAGARATSGSENAETRSRQAPAAAGRRVHRVSGFLVGAGASLAGIFAPGAFDIHNPQTLTAAISLLALAGLLVVITPRVWMRSGTGALAQRSWFRLALYLAGELVALAITWIARWLGADNAQAFVLAPGSYMLLVGAFLPADQRVPHARRIGQFTSLAASLLLMLPTLYQTFTEPSLTAEFVYGSVVLLEALVIVGLGVGIHSRLLVLVGSAFIGVDTLGGAALAVQKGVPIGLVIGVLALVLIGLATWLSLRIRREESQP